MTISAEFQLSRPPALGLAAAEEIAILEQAATRTSLTAVQTKRLASLLYFASEFERTIALYETLDIKSQPDALLRQGEAHLALEIPAHVERAITLFEQALRAEPNDILRVALYERLGDAERLRRNDGAAREWMGKAIALRPGNPTTPHRLAAMDLASGNASAILERGEAALKNNVRNTGTLNSQILALAALARRDEAIALMGWKQFAHHEIVGPPTGWKSVEAFNAALAAELTTHPGRRLNRPRTASRATWRVDSPLLLRSILVPQFCDLVERELRAYLDRLPRCEHPFVAARPEAASLHFWAVTTEGEGYEEWHIHPGGWLSGVYYVAVPDSVTNGDTSEGCIEFGVPPARVGDSASDAIGRTLLRPRPGLIALFPSYVNHRTFPHGSGTRICIAFDIVPRATSSR